MFVTEENLSGVPLKGRFLVVLINIRLRRKGLPVINTLTFVNYGHKKFCKIRLGTGRFTA